MARSNSGGIVDRFDHLVDSVLCDFVADEDAEDVGDEEEYEEVDESEHGREGFIN